MKILAYPNPFLKKKLAEVKTFDEELQLQTAEMIRTMKKTSGLGLAANQVGIDKRIIVVDADLCHNYDETIESKGQLVLINPFIFSASVDKIEFNEGCLSLQNLFIPIKRSKWIRVRYTSETGEMQVLDAHGMLSIVLQHEVDHLDGKTMLDQLGETERYMSLNKLRKLRNKK